MSRIYWFSAFLAACCCCVTSGELDLDRDWWKKTIVYQIYPRSFQDSDGDGVGDLRGIISRLDHFSYLNIGTIWLSPFYKSPMVDFGYDVADYTDVDPMFGNLRDFDELVEEAHKRGIRILVDFIPNHTSDKHQWFEKSRSSKSKDDPFSDYYVWHDGKLSPSGERVPPNNWISVFSSNSWTWDSNRKQFYFHQFTREQPDLNYRNPKVRQEILKILKFWLDRGVDGFRVDAIATMFEVDDKSLDEPRSFKENFPSTDYEYLIHKYTTHLPEIHDVVREWRDLFDEHDRLTGKHTFMVTEVYDETFVESMKYYESGSDMPFNFNLIEANKTCYGRCFRHLINSWIEHMPEGRWSNNVLGNHDRHRITVRKGLQFADAMNVLLLTLPGTPTTYYGEEIAMNEIDVAFEDVQDPWGKNVGPEYYLIYNRDPCRTPMQWNDDINAGFSSALRTWLPLHPDYKSRNVEAQKRQGLISHLEIYRFAAKLRQERALQTSHMTFLNNDNENLVSYLRYDPDEPDPVFLITMNVGKDVAHDNHEVTLDGKIFTKGKLLLDTESRERVGDTIALKNIRLKSGQAYVIKLTKRTNEEL